MTWGGKNVCFTYNSRTSRHRNDVSNFSDDLDVVPDENLTFGFLLEIRNAWYSKSIKGYKFKS